MDDIYYKTYKQNQNNNSDYHYTVNTPNYSESNYRNIYEVKNIGLITQPEPNIFMFGLTCGFRACSYIFYSLIFVGCLIGVIYFIIKIIEDGDYINLCGCFGLLIGCGYSIYLIFFYVKNIYLILGEKDIIVNEKNLCCEKPYVIHYSDVIKFEVNLKIIIDKAEDFKTELYTFDFVLINQEKITIYEDKKRSYEDKEINFLVNYVNRKIQERK